jgi:predicted nucleic acid-binding protein
MFYFDTSFLVPLVVSEATSDKVQRFFARSRTEPLVISQWTHVEVLSALARLVRMKGIDARAAARADAQFETVVAESFVVLLPTQEDFDLSMQYLRQYKTGLRAGDALHLAIAANHRANAIYSLDLTFLKAGRLLGLPTKSGIRSH